MSADERAVSTASTAPGDAAPLLDEERGAAFRDRWHEIQAAFVDRPREAVQEADGLVSEVMHSLSTGFARTRSELEAQWDGGGPASTEDLRVALTRYRSFFDRLLAV